MAMWWAATWRLKAVVMLWKCKILTKCRVQERRWLPSRQLQDERLKQVEQQLQEARQETAKWKAEAQKWQTANENLKQRALKAYYEQQDEIKRLKEQLNKKI